MRAKFFLCLCVLALGGVLEAAFIVEPHSTGLGFSNFGGTPRYSSTKGTAPGLIATNSAFGSTIGTAGPHQYVFSYTPGSNPDNWNPAKSQYYGNGFYAPASVVPAGGQTGYYNVYITWPATTGMTSYCNLAITHEGTTTTHSNLDMNTGGTSAMAQAVRNSFSPPPIAGTVYLGGNNAWLRIASNVLLNANETYTVTQTATTTLYTSMRSAGVMWEFVSVPEPATLGLLSLGGLLLARKR